MSRFGRSVQRSARQFVAKLKNAPSSASETGEMIPRVLESHAAQIAELRLMAIPPAAAGAGDTDHDDVFDPAYKTKLNARKRARRARRGK